MAFLGILLCLLAPPSVAQQPANLPPEQFYPPQPEETLSGKVKHTYRPDHRAALLPHHMMIRLQTDRGEIRIRLGPADYIDSRLKLAVGDRVEVRGRRVTVKGPFAAGSARNEFIASEVKKGSQVLKLRDSATGRYLWLQDKRPGGDR